MGRELDILVGIRESNMSELLKYHSARNDFNVNTYTATSGEQLKYKIDKFEYDAVISDYDLVDSTALEVLKHVNTRTPFIIHTWYHNRILEDKVLDEGALALKQKNKHLSYFNELVHMVSDHSKVVETKNGERPDIKLRVNSKGRILQGNGLSQGELETVGNLSDISPFIDRNQVEEAIRETLELGDSSLEAIMEDRQGLVNYNLYFTKLQKDQGISVTALPEQELDYMDEKVYRTISDSSAQKVRD